MNWEILAHDDPDFVGIVQKLATGAVLLGEPRHMHVVHIDNWFGDRWLGFQGKFLGALGVRTDSTHPDRSYCLPPFHPNRVLSQHSYSIDEDGNLHVATALPPLHTRRTSARNFSFKMSEIPDRLDISQLVKKGIERSSFHGVYTWYSGKTATHDRGSLMVYTHSESGTLAWYVELKKCTRWRPMRRVGIGDSEWRELIRRGRLTEIS